MGNTRVMFAIFSSPLLLPLAQWSLHIPPGSQFAGFQNCTQQLITTGNVHTHSFRPPVSPWLFPAHIYTHTLFLLVCTSEICETPLQHLRNLITSDQVWGRSHGKYYITSDMLHLQRWKGRKKNIKTVKKKKSSLGMSVKLQRSSKNFNGLRHEKVGKSKSVVSTPNTQPSDPSSWVTACIYLIMCRAQLL